MIDSEAWQVFSEELEAGTVTEVDKILAKILLLSYRGALIESGRYVAEDTDEGAWDRVNELLTEFREKTSEEQVFELGVKLATLAVDEDPRKEWINRWVRINGWELLVDEDYRGRLAAFLETTEGSGLATALQKNVAVDVANLPKGDYLEYPEGYLGFVSACVGLQLAEAAVGTVAREIADQIRGRLDEEKFRGLMAEISTWQDAARPAAVMRPFLERMETEVVISKDK